MQSATPAIMTIPEKVEAFHQAKSGPEPSSAPVIGAPTSAAMARIATDRRERAQSARRRGREETGEGLQGPPIRIPTSAMFFANCTCRPASAHTTTGQTRDSRAYRDVDARKERNVGSADEAKDEGERNDAAGAPTRQQDPHLRSSISSVFILGQNVTVTDHEGGDGDAGDEQVVRAVLVREKVGDRPTEDARGVEDRERVEGDLRDRKGARRELAGVGWGQGKGSDVRLGSSPWRQQRLGGKTVQRKMVNF